MTDKESVIYFTLIPVNCGGLVTDSIYGCKIRLLGLLLISAWFFASGFSTPPSNHQKRKIRHIGVIVYADPFLKSYDGLRAGLQEKGYRLDTEVIFAVHSLDHDLSVVETLVKGFAAADFDLIFTATTVVTEAVKACQHKNRINIPVVFTVVAAPVDSKIVTNLRHPGANITGISHVSKELLPQRLLLFKQAFPEIKRIAVFFNPENRLSRTTFNQPDLHLAARDMGVIMVPERVRNLEEMQNLCRTLNRDKVDSIFMLPDVLSVTFFAEFVKLSRRLQIPLMVIDNRLLKQGGVMGYSPDFYAVGMQSATLVDQIFKGVRPGDLAIQNPEKVKLTVSLKELQKLNLKISENILLQADEVLR